MQIKIDIQALVKKAEARDLSDPGALENYFQCLRLLEEEDKKEAHRRCKEARGLAARYAREQGSARMLDIQKRALLFDAPMDFDAYCRYIEWDREKPFYLPRRRQLLVVTKQLQRLADKELELLAVSLPPGVGKTTLALFYLTWLAGREPDKPILGGSHSNSFLRGAFGECQRIFNPKGEYLWADVFPDVKLVKSNAEDMFLDLGREKRFSTLQFRSVGAGNAGVVRAEQLLYCDDLCQGIEEAMSRDRMDTLWTKYSTDLRQRKIGDCRELHIATRWSVHDVIGRLERSYSEERNETGEAEFIAIPALDENDESNFDYGPHAAGFTTRYFHLQREMMDDASWRALYMNEPIEREGQLYNEDELQRYLQLPSGEPDAVLSVCDTKEKGRDYCFMPVVYQYGQKYYLEACVCDNGKQDAVEAQLISLLLAHKVQLSCFESNSAGGEIAKKVQKAVAERGGVTSITMKYTTANKETKIIVNAPWVKEHVVFKDKSLIGADKAYRQMMTFLCGYTMAGKNKHDDVPDGMAQLALYAQSLQGGAAEVKRRPY